MGTVKAPSLEVRGTLDYILITLAHYLCGNIKKSVPLVATQLAGTTLSCVTLSLKSMC